MSSLLGHLIARNGGNTLLDLGNPATWAAIPTFVMHAPTVEVSGKPKQQRKRKPSMAAAARLSAKESVEIKMAPDGTVTMTPVKPLEIAPTTETGNEWDRLQ